MIRGPRHTPAHPDRYLAHEAAQCSIKLKASSGKFGEITRQELDSILYEDVVSIKKSWRFWQPWADGYVVVRTSPGRALLTDRGDPPILWLGEERPSHWRILGTVKVVA